MNTPKQTWQTSSGASSGYCIHRCWEGTIQNELGESGAWTDAQSPCYFLFETQFEDLTSASLERCSGLLLLGDLDVWHSDVGLCLIDLIAV